MNIQRTRLDVTCCKCTLHYRMCTNLDIWYSSLEGTNLKVWCRDMSSFDDSPSGLGLKRATRQLEYMESFLLADWLTYMGCGLETVQNVPCVEPRSIGYWWPIINN